MNISIGTRRVGDGEPTYVIAEAGSNHDGKLDQALQLIDLAAEARADAVKFQTFRARTMYPQQSSRPVEYLQRLGISKNIFEIIQEMEMPLDWIPVLAARSAERGIHFPSTPFDEHCADLLAPHVPAFKIASYELTHLPLIAHAAAFGKPMILSTGAANIDEIQDAIDACASAGNHNVCLTQCTAKYPAEPEAINVRAVVALKSRFDVPVGLSDHSRHPTYAPAAAVALGANIIEKHFTISRDLPGPDHSFAIEPDELRDMVLSIRETERVLGSGVKQVQQEELELMNYRRSIFTARKIRKGEGFSLENLVVLRRSGVPETNLLPKHLQSILGRRAARDLDAETILESADVQ